MPYRSTNIYLMHSFIYRFWFTAVASTLILPVAGLTHDFWIEPTPFAAAPGASIEIRLREGTDFKGNTLPYIPEWFRDFSSTDTSGRVAIESLPGDDPAAILVAEPGQTLLGYHSNRNYTELDAEKFNKYLEDEGIEFIRQQRIDRGEDNDPAPEFFVRCAKALIGDAGSGDVYKQVLGYTLELTPVANPHELRTGDKLSFALTFRRQPADGLLLQAFSRDNPDDIQRIRTDASGIGQITLDRPGVWMVKAVNIQPIIGDPKAKWQSYWASFVFELPDRD